MSGFGMKKMMTALGAFLLIVPLASVSASDSKSSSAKSGSSKSSDDKRQDGKRDDDKRKDDKRGDDKYESLLQSRALWDNAREMNCLRSQWQVGFILANGLRLRV